MQSLPCAVGHTARHRSASAACAQPRGLTYALCFTLTAIGACAGDEPDLASQRATADAAASSGAPAEPDAGDDGAPERPVQDPTVMTPRPSPAPSVDLDAGDDDGGMGGLDSCDVKAPTACPDPPLRYAAVEPIFTQHCAVCHNGMDGRWPLTSYQHVADWYAEIRGQLLACTMPPRDSGVTITREERERILLWIRCGFPR